MYERGNAGVNVTLIVVILIVLALFIAGYFKSDRVFWDTFNLKATLRLPCGLTVNDPKPDSKTEFPFAVDGYANECGWTVVNGSAGTAQIFDSKGFPVTLPTALTVVPESTSAPYYFKTNLILHSPPHTDAGNVLLVSSSGLIYSIPVTF